MTAPLVLGGHVDDHLLHGLVGLAVDDLGQDVRGRDLQLVAFPPHGLDQDGQVHLAAAHDPERVGGGGVLHPQGHVLEQLAVEPVADLTAGDVLAFAAGQGAVVDREGHLHGGVVDLDKGQGLHLGGVAQGVADGDVGQAREGHDVAGGDVVAGDTAVGLEVVQFGQAALHADRRVVPVADHHFLAHAAGAVLDAADADAAHKIIVVDGGHQHLEGGHPGPPRGARWCPGWCRTGAPGRCRGRRGPGWRCRPGRSSRPWGTPAARPRRPGPSAGTAPRPLLL